nr:PREDICTED: uncharacterized protein LOC106703058 isoform X2 [Latimeria chalumnae]|eukprot:XP_014342532.1 PREDICTED: uncharacterized protein LOC106703058 isoform X2 [Latimeria chalumnae]
MQRLRHDFKKYKDPKAQEIYQTTYMDDYRSFTEHDVHHYRIKPCPPEQFLSRKTTEKEEAFGPTVLERDFQHYLQNQARMKSEENVNKCKRSGVTFQDQGYVYCTEQTPMLNDQEERRPPVVDTEQFTQTFLKESQEHPEKYNYLAPGVQGRIHQAAPVGNTGVTPNVATMDSAEQNHSLQIAPSLGGGMLSQVNKQEGPISYMHGSGKRWDTYENFIRESSRARKLQNQLNKMMLERSNIFPQGLHFNGDTTYGTDFKPWSGVHNKLRRVLGNVSHLPPEELNLNSWVTEYGDSYGSYFQKLQIPSIAPDFTSVPPGVMHMPHPLPPRDFMVRPEEKLTTEYMDSYHSKQSTTS